MKSVLLFLIMATLSISISNGFSKNVNGDDSEIQSSGKGTTISESQTADQKTSIKKKIRRYLLNGNFESVLHELLNYSHENYYLNESHETVLGDAYTIVYCYLMLDQYKQAEEYIYGLTSKFGFERVSGIYYLRGWVDCFNDNYGNAIDSFSLEIVAQLKKMADGDYSGVSILFLSYEHRANVYAVMGIKNETYHDLQRMSLLRKSFSYLPQQKMITESILDKFLEDDTGSVVVYRIKDFKSMPYTKNKETGEVAFGMKLMWWSSISDSDPKLMQMKKSDMMETPLGEFKTLIHPDD